VDVLTKGEPDEPKTIVLQQFGIAGAVTPSKFCIYKAVVGPQSVEKA